MQANAGGLGFDGVLAEFGVVHAQLQELQAALRPQLAQYVAHPAEVTEANQNCAHRASMNMLL